MRADDGSSTPPSQAEQDAGDATPAAPESSTSRAEPSQGDSAGDPGPSVSGGTKRRSPIGRFVFLGAGLLTAFYLGAKSPREQHVRIVLGAASPDVTGLALQYVAGDGDVAREAHFAFPSGGAPRIVAHEPRLPDGDYVLDIEVDAREGRRGVQRRVTLGGGSTQVDVSSALVRDMKPHE